MKKSVVFMSALSIVAMCSGAYAANPDTGPGCGLGKLAWDNFKNQKNIAPQVLMATTNGTFGSQTFGISSGTSGCTNDGQVWSQVKDTMFAGVNLDSLTQEMAQGRGEHLASLATLMGVPAEHHAAFFSMTQDRYNSLVAAGEQSPKAFVQALNEGISGHPVLAKVVVR